MAKLLTAKFIEDKVTGGYTAICVEIPAIVSQGETLSEAEDNLFKILVMVLNDAGMFEDSEEDTELGKIITRTYHI